MPELPDVEQFKKFFDRHALKKKIKEIKILNPTTLRVSPKKLRQELLGHKFLETQRRGKFLEIFTNGASSLVLHFGMTGKLAAGGKGKPTHQFCRVIFEFDDGTNLQYLSKRQLGKIYLVRNKEFNKIETIKKMGPEPLEPTFTFEGFKKICKKRKRAIKPLLLDQSFVAGIGNIYADESLYQAGIRPTRKVNTLSENELKRLYDSIKKVLRRALKVSARTKRLGKYYIIPHRRTDQVCPRCKAQLVRVRQVGRSAYFCPNCQR
jgi:formamidopyrimidine-DNA glycosylase